ncbi:hypothetical protein CVT24_006266 [Panaeolus cyanescens]|uniref:Pre-rRNA-processing protein IPI3 n=1 Tax=Panaeolus cyanescens TaxID=181874 RepID=A0A409V8J0_9AGAR|nr:hypothetical protein CVT24_006266 [Panaeolus cyanescens]
MLVQESIICATAPTTSASSPGLLALHDIQTGQALASFKQSSSAHHSVAISESTNAQGGFILAAQADKSLLNVYNFQKDQLALKIVLPEKLTCIAIDRRGLFCAGGTAAGRIYLWEIASGILYNAWDAHYRQVNVLRFTNDGAALLSGSDDSGSPELTIAQLWDLSSRSLLTTFQFPQPISLLTWDVTERFFFAASTEGQIHQMNMFIERESKIGGLVTEAVGGAGVMDVIRADDEASREARKKRLITVGHPISSMCISLTSGILVVGTSDGQIILYDIPSHQVLRTITQHKGYSINYLQTMLKPPDLIGHTNLTETAIDTKDVIPVKPVLPFQRMRDPKARDAHEVTVVLRHKNKEFRYETSEYSSDELLRDHAYFVQPTSAATSDSDPVSMKTKLLELEAEVEQLREQLGKAKGINDTMWDTVVQKLAGQNKNTQQQQQSRSSSQNVEDPEESQRRKKRGRAS